jgi:hypothetical protein
MLPQKVLFDGAAEDFGEDYAALLVAFRNYLNEHHPLSKRLSLARDMPGERIDLNSVVRLEAHGEQSGAMELAFLDSGVPRPADASNRVMYFDMKRKERGEKPNVSVSTHNALYEVLQFPLLFEEGKGGYYLSPDREDGVVSTTGERLSLQEYTRAMFYQNPRLHCLGRLAQEYALVQHSRHVENILNYQRYNLQAKLMRQRRDVGVAEGGVGKRLAMSTSVVGSVGYNQALIEDSCAVSAQMGQGSLFITMTCNPHWPEITAALEPGQSWEDRPDVVNRVFKLKLQELLEDLRQGKLYKRQDGSPWKTKYIMYVVEFQKRGKPTTTHAPPSRAIHFFCVLIVSLSSVMGMRESGDQPRSDYYQ